MPNSTHTIRTRRSHIALIVAGTALLLIAMAVAFGPILARGSIDGQARNLFEVHLGSTQKPTVPSEKSEKESAGTAEQRSAQAAAFTACMRDNGVPDFPGITIAGDGTVRLTPGGAVDPISGTYRAAAEICATKLPHGSPLPVAPTMAAPSIPAAPAIDCNGAGCPAEPVSPRAPTPPN